MAKALEEITRHDFERYESVRQSGVINMLSSDVQALAGIDRDTHLAIIKNYTALNTKWPEVRGVTK